MGFPKMIIRHKGVFNLEELFKVMRRWFMDQGYEWHEKVVKHKVPSPAGAEDQYFWHNWKYVTEYAKFTIDLYMHIWDNKEVEVVRDGKKQTLNQCAIFFEITPDLSLDYQGRFEKNKFLLRLREWFHEYVWKNEIEDGWEDEAYYRAYKFHRVIKEYLDFESAHNAEEATW